MARASARLAARLAPLLVAIVVGACSSVAPSAARSAAPTASPVDTPLIVIGSLPPASALPSDLIACTQASDQLVVRLHAPHGLIDARGTLAQGNAGSPIPSDNPSAAPTAPSTPVPPAAPIPDAGELVGGQPYVVEVSLNAGNTLTPIAPKAIEAIVSVAGAAPAAQVEQQANSANVILPDGNGAATLSLFLTFSNPPCPDVLASVQFAFHLVPAATAASCPTQQPDYVDLLAKFKPHLRLGTADVPWTIQGFLARYTSVGGSSQVPEFAAFNPTIPATVLPRARALDIASTTQGLTLTGADVTVWRRADVVAPDNTVLPTPGSPVTTDTLTAKGGVITWPSPKAAGDYVVGITPRWSQACATGSGYTYLSVSLT